MTYGDHAGAVCVYANTEIQRRRDLTATTPTLVFTMAVDVDAFTGMSTPRELIPTPSARGAGRFNAGFVLIQSKYCVVAST